MSSFRQNSVQAGSRTSSTPGTTWFDAAKSIRDDEFFLDPTRLTLVSGEAGFDGTQLKGISG